MRNLKRALSLTLASVMLLGMMVLGTSAASYPDVTDEHNVEAIGVLQAVGVMSGSNNGNFNPDAKISRIEMAIVMANLLDLDVDYFQGQNTFSDVPDWASGYVNACAAHGIVSGVGGGRFGTGNVTATQAALMMLKALGYFQYNSDFGSNWAQATALQASRIRLFDGINAQDNTQLSRNQVAQLALNALKADMVDPDASGNLNITMPDGTSVTTGNVNYVVRTTDAAFADAIDDTLGGGSIDGRNGKIIQLGEQLYSGDLKLNDDDNDDFGRPASTWTYKNDKVGTYANKSERIATYTTKASKGDIYNLLSSTVRSGAVGSGSDKNFTVHVNGQEITNTNYAAMGVKSDPSTPSNLFVRNSSEEIYTPVSGSSRRGTVTEVYLDSDNNVDIVIIDTFVYQATSNYNANRDDVIMAAVGDTKITLKPGELTLSGEDYDIENIQADDYLLVNVTTEDDGLSYSVNAIEVARKVTGDVTGYTEGSSVTIDGTTYNYSATTLNSGSGVRTTQYTVGQPAVVVLDKYDNIIAVDEAVASSNFVFIKRFGSTTNFNSDAAAEAYFTDGSKATINVDRVENVKSASAIATSGITNRWYTYSVNSNGSYVLYAPPTRYGATSAAATKTATVTGDGTAKLISNGKVDFMTGALANNNTILVMVDTDGAVMTYTGTANIPDVTPANTVPLSAYYLVDSDGYTDYVFTDLDGKNVSVVDGGEDDSFVYVTRFDGVQQGANATTYFTYKVANESNSGEANMSFDQRLLSADEVAGAVFALYYKPRTNSDNEITSLTPVPDTGKYINKDITNGTVSYSNGSMTVTGGGASYIVNGSSKIILVARDGLLKRDPAANNEIYEVQPTTLESLLANRSFNGNIAGAKVSSSSNVIDTLYVTVDSAVDFRDVEVSPASLTLTNSSADTTTGKEITVTLPAGVTVSSATSGDSTIATVTGSLTAGQSNTLTVKSVANGQTAISFTVTKSGATYTFTVPVTVSGFPVLTDAELVDKAESDVPTALSSGVGDTETDLTDEDAAKQAVKDAVTAALPAGVEVDESARTFEAGWEFGEFTAPVNGTEGSPDGTDGKFASVNVQIKKGNELGLIEMTNVTVKATAYVACEHEDLAATSAKDATCAAEGNIAYWTCNDCGKIFSDATAETETDAESVKIDKLTTHTKGDSPSYTQGTDETGGGGEDHSSQHSYTCTVCSETIWEDCNTSSGNCVCGRS